MSHIVQGDGHVLETHVTASQRMEVPEPPGIAETGIAPEDADFAVAVSPPYGLEMDPEESLRKGADESCVVHALIDEVARIVVEAETGMVIDGCKGPLG